jgi:pimeloyl-ACP methyl ester carboxylesterase
MSKPAKSAAWFAIAVGIATACIIAAKSHAATPFPDAATERFSVTVTGSGPDVILIPGLASSAATWDGTVAHLKAHYRLHMLNVAGFAGEPAGANASGAVVAPTVEAIDLYIKANHLKPVVIGHSLGGTMGLMLARAHPEDVAKLIIVDALPYAGVMFNPAATVDIVKPYAAAMESQIEAMSDETFKTQETGTLAHMVTAPADVTMLAAWRAQSNRHTVAQALYDDMVTDLRPDIANIETPGVLLFPVDAADGQDPTATRTFYRSQYAAMPHLTMVEIDNSRHFEMLDQPEAFNAALDAALK